MRERDIRNAVQAVLLATGQFSDVWISGLPENYGQGVSDLTAAALEPVSTSLSTGWDAQTDGSLTYTMQLAVTLLARNSDPQLRDEAVEQLLDTFIDAVQGSPIVPGFTVPGMTRVNHWAWQTPTPPERRIRAVLSVAYLTAWDDFDTSV